jgi:tetraacyldisaccharide 4'-kinase
MRGYGDDEPEVHELLNPSVPVYTGAVRAVGIARAAADGADVVVMDDAFQHRRAGRLVDVVLVSAERWREGERLLPAGSLRESPAALRRASLVIVTHKIATPDVVERVMAAVTRAAPDVPVAAMHLRLDVLHGVGGEAAPVPLSDLRGERILALAGIGDPESFFLQLDALGARVTRRSFPDHHAYSLTEGEALSKLGEDHKYVISTLKDAVKLRRVWPAKGPPLWYVSQAVEVSACSVFIDTMVRQLLSF